MAPLTVNTPLQPSELLSSADSRAAIRRRFIAHLRRRLSHRNSTPRVLRLPDLLAEREPVVSGFRCSIFGYTLTASPVGEQGALRISASHWPAPLPIATLS